MKILFYPIARNFIAEGHGSKEESQQKESGRISEKRPGLKIVFPASPGISSSFPGSAP
jgi:hypothetical protein